MTTSFAYIPPGQAVASNDSKTFVEQNVQQLAASLQLPPDRQLWIQTQAARQPLSADSNHPEPFQAFSYPKS
jgi:hypothetical protein